MKIIKHILGILGLLGIILAIAGDKNWLIPGAILLAGWMVSTKTD